MYKILSIYSKDQCIFSGEKHLDEKELFLFILNNNVSYFISDKPVYKSLEKYGIYVSSSNTPNYHWLNMIQKIEF
jgi:hypothetical protein